jgi:hypothetical protein
MGIVIGDTYEHYKGQRYRVLMLGRDSESTEEVVVYQGLYDSEEFGENPVWVRPVKEFVETVEIEGVIRPRFLHVGE